MGKRKDRRQQQASGRRVKLDLSTDDALPPSETPGSLEVLDSSLGEEVKAGARNQEAALDNPLSLLGQYSDDDEDEDDEHGVGGPADISTEPGKDISNIQEELKNVDISQFSERLSDGEQTTSSQLMVDDGHKPGNISASEMILKDLTTENEWQSVLHEDTGEYYYWNVQTGETTWVRPALLESKDAGGAGSGTNQTADCGTESASVNEEGNTQNAPGKLDNITACENDTKAFENHVASFSSPKDTALENASRSVGTDPDCLRTHVVDLESDTASLEKLEDIEGPKYQAHAGIGMQGNIEYGNQIILKKNQENGGEDKTSLAQDQDATSEALEKVQGGCESNLQHECREMESVGVGTSPCQAVALECRTTSLESNTELEGKIAFCIETGEALQQRLNNLAGESLVGVSRQARMILQTQARITDWRAFCAFGFVAEACLSFIQSELTELESALAAEEATEEGKQKAVQCMAVLGASDKERPARRDTDWSLNQGYYQQSSSTASEPWKQGQPSGTAGNVDDIEEGEIQTSTGEVHIAYSDIHEGVARNVAGGEDADMDVDMEVDEVEAEPAVPGMNSDVLPLHAVPVPYTVTYSLPNAGALAAVDSVAVVGEAGHYCPIPPTSDTWAPPLPPDDEWTPPPPGETESVPPPPPDEQPPLLPQSPQLVRSYSVHLESSVAQAEYFAPEYMTEYTTLSEYIPAPDASLYGPYIEEVPGVGYSNSLQLIDSVNLENVYVVPSDSSTVYNGWMPPVISSRASLSFPVVKASIPTQTLEAAASMPSSSAPSVPTASSMPPDSGASSEAKKLTKGKVKKRTHAVAAAPMLNKKVSSLVSKWKQAKEELHGGEEDEDDKTLYDVESLEKKKQKEIEEWRRQQIASGEALDNANFQPLGTLDWRERVKRARKSDAKEAKEGEKHVEASIFTVEGQNQEATKIQKLSELSRGLPAGWQAFWDDASGEVYYGNLATQETTWDRPVT